MTDIDPVHLIMPMIAVSFLFGSTICCLLRRGLFPLVLMYSFFANFATVHRDISDYYLYIDGGAVGNPYMVGLYCGLRK